MSFATEPFRDIPVPHARKIQPTLDEIADLGADGVAHVLYTQTARRLARDLEQQTAAVASLPWCQQHLAALTVLRTATDNAWYFTQQPHVLRVLYRKLASLWRTREWFNALDTTTQVETIFDKLLEHSTTQPASPAMRTLALSLVWHGDDDTIDHTLFHVARHASAMCGVRDYLTRRPVDDDERLCIRWRLEQLTDSEQRTTHHVVVLDEDDYGAQWAAGLCM